MNLSLPTPLPLFPLRSVLFPGGLLQLKVFEARYLDLVSACLRAGQPFGVVCLRQGEEVRSAHEAVSLEEVGVLARLDDVSADEPGILRVRCTGLHRFRLLSAAEQRRDGLWQAPCEGLADDPPRSPEPPHLATVRALAQAIASMKGRGDVPIAQPYLLNDAGWVANRWCELLPISVQARQRLMQLEDPLLRLSLVADYLRGKGVVGDES